MAIFETKFLSQLYTGSAQNIVSNCIGIAFQLDGAESALIEIQNDSGPEKLVTLEEGDPTWVLTAPEGSLITTPFKISFPSDPSGRLIVIRQVQETILA